MIRPLHEAEERFIKTRGKNRTAILSSGAIIIAVLALSSIISVVYAATTTLTSPNSEAEGRFGSQVAISGSTVVVGAFRETVGGKADAGRAYIFDAPTGSLDTTLTSPNSQILGQFGESVAISGSTVVVGATAETVNGMAFAGRVYIFDAPTGSLDTTLTSPNSQADGLFGGSVAISGSTVVVGAPGETVSGQVFAGRAYIFDATTGSLDTTLTSPNSQAGGFFGNSVAISGSTVIVGAPEEIVNGQRGAGHAYIFDAPTGSLDTTLTSPNSVPGGSFGISVAISGSTVIVGALGETVSGQVFAGRAYIFDATTGSLDTTLTSPNSETGGFFGDSVAFSGSTVAVGAPQETVSGQVFAGRAYIFDATTGSLDTTLTSPNSQADGEFGASVAIGGSTVVVGAPLETVSGQGGAGRVYIFG